MPRSTPSSLAMAMRRLMASVGALTMLAAASAVPELGLFTPAAAASPWDQIGRDIDGATAGDQSGYSLALSDDGTRLAVGAVRDDGTHAGYVRVFQWTGSAWSQMGADIDAESVNDESGYSVALSADGSRLAVGARLNNGAANFAGHVRVFQWTGSAWQQVGADIDGEAQYEQSGYSVALSADGARLAVGAPGGDSNRGLVRVYLWSGTTWTQLGETISGDTVSDTSGWSVALSDDGTRLAVGSPGNDDSAPNAGRVSVFTWTGSAWTRMGFVDGEAPGDFSGRSVALSADGSRLAVGAAKNDDAGADAGHVRVYSWSGAAWMPLGADIDGQSANDQSGASVALSADGSRLAVGATGAGPGQVRIFLWTGSTWLQSGANVIGEAADDRSGTSVAMAADGVAFAVGAPRNDGAGDNAGHVRVHGSLTPTPVPGPPLDVSGVASDSQVTVSWSAPLSDGGSPITGYSVTASPGGATCSTSGALSCTVAGLTNGTAYTFAVMATNGEGTGPPSAVPGWLTPATLPGAPTGATARLSGETEAVVWWTAPESNGGSAIVSYTVTASPGGASCETTGALSCTVSGLTAGETYAFTVAATNGIGTGPPSAASETVVATAPDAPTGVIAVAGDATATVSWSAPVSDGGSPITIYTATAIPGGATCSTAVLLSCTVTGLTNDIAHTFTVTATNAIGTSPASTATAPVTPTGPSGEVTSVVPGTPTSVAASPGDRAATVTWVAPAPGSGAPVTGYTATAWPGGATCSTTAALTCTVTGLTNGVTYSITVVASSAGVTGMPSAPAVSVTPTTNPPDDGDVGAGSVVNLPATLAPCPTPALPFTDTAQVISEADVACLFGLGITTGTSATTYSPDGLVDRNQMASFLARLWRAAGLECPSPALPFTDIAQVISQSDIACLYGLDITTGTSPTTYGPHGLVDRNQMASFLARLWRAAGLECPAPTVPFTDIGSVISEADVACIYGLGITTGTSPTTYSPDGLGGLVDRDQMASFLARMWRAIGDS
ncbi:MAG: fibronectin type III domain-containing protein [Acidimicrobiales bacterium]